VRIIYDGFARPSGEKGNDDKGGGSRRLAGRGASSTDWSPLKARAEVVFFERAFDDENDAATQLADFDIVLSMRERTPLPATLIDRLPRLRMLGITGARNLSLDTLPAPREA